MEHTETPWKVAADFWKSNTRIVEVFGSHVLAVTIDCHPVTAAEAEANAKFIVKACNNHDRLVETLKALYTEFEFQTAAYEGGSLDDLRDKVKAALLAVKEENHGTDRHSKEDVPSTGADKPTD